MLRIGGSTRPLHWADKTMSGLRARQLEACEKYLAGLSCHCLFDADCTDEDAESLYDLSWFASEEKRIAARKRSLHTIEELRARVLGLFPAEFALLSEEEHDLMIRAALLGGHYPLRDWDETDPARSLVRRLWCKVEKQEDDLVLSLPHQLCVTALLLLTGDAHVQIREILSRVMENVDDSLYLLGVTRVNGPLLHLKSLLKDTFVSGYPQLIERFLYASCDYLYGLDGETLLIHPGLADPDRLLQSPSANFNLSILNEDDLSSALDSLESIENPIYDRMLGLMMGAVRPEITPEDAVEDLIILAKQNVSFDDMREVFSAMLIMQPTREMLKALKDLSDLTPRWLCLSTSRLQ